MHISAQFNHCDKPTFCWSRGLNLERVFMSTNAIKSAASQLIGEPVIVSPKAQMKFDLSKAEKSIVAAVQAQGGRVPYTLQGSLSPHSSSMPPVSPRCCRGRGSK